MSDQRTLDKAEQHAALHLARQTIAHYLSTGDMPDLTISTPGLLQRGGCFVSLHHKNGALRGCMGTFDDSQPLWQNIQIMAIASATRDPRFEPLAPEELGDHVIEISALSVPQEIAVDDIEVGKHGLMVHKNLRRGVLLPQVATEYHWDKKTFLEHTCAKAGLPSDAWKHDDVHITAFTAQVFSETPSS